MIRELPLPEGAEVIVLGDTACQAVRLVSQQAELRYLADRLKTPTGIATLRRVLRNSFAPEYQAAL